MFMAPHEKIQNITYFSNAESLQMKINFELSSLVERYQIEHIYNIVFRYRVFVTKLPVIMESNFAKSAVPLNRNTKNNIFSDYYAPMSLNSLNYGKLIEDNGDIKTYLYADRFILERELISINGNEGYKVNVINKVSKDLVTQFTDERVGNSEFKRLISGYTLFIKSGRIVYCEIPSNCKFIQSDTQDHIESEDMTNFITYDLECYLDKHNNFIPYAAGWHKNGNTKTYYLSEFGDSDSLIIKSFDDLLVKENKNCAAHVRSHQKFDSVFIVKALMKSEYKTKLLCKDGKILSLSVTKGSGSKNSIKLTRAISFVDTRKVETIKGVFPHSFVNDANLNYIGKLPGFEFYPKDSFNHINEHNILERKFGSNWNLREECIKYLESDVVSLYQIILSFRKLVYDSEKVDITKCISNAGLSFKIFKTNFLSQIPSRTFVESEKMSSTDF